MGTRYPMDSLRRRAGSAVHALRVSIPCPLPGSWSRCVPLFPPANPPPPCLALVLAAGEGTARAGRHLSLLHCARLRPIRQRFGRTPLTRLSGVECLYVRACLCVGSPSRFAATTRRTRWRTSSPSVEGSRHGSTQRARTRCCGRHGTHDVQCGCVCVGARGVACSLRWRLGRACYEFPQSLSSTAKIL